MIFKGTIGWRLAKKHQKILLQELNKLADEFEPRGLLVSADLFVGTRGKSWPAMAYLHVYLNGMDSATTTVFHKTLGLSIINENVISPGACVNELFDKLPAHFQFIIDNKAIIKELWNHD